MFLFTAESLEIYVPLFIFFLSVIGYGLRQIFRTHHRMTIFAILSLISTAFGSAPSVESVLAPIQELKVKNLWIGKEAKDLSGISMWNNRFFAVADDTDDHFIYEIKFEQKRFSLKPWQDLSQLAQWKSYLEWKNTLPENARKLDLEGIHMCSIDDAFLIDERASAVLRVQKNMLYWRALHEKDPVFFSSEANARLEGIAVDCKKELITIGKERDPRKFFQYDWKSQSWSDLSNPPPSTRSPQRAFNPWTGVGLIDILSDVSALEIWNNQVYALERATLEIVRMGPQPQRMSFLRSEHNGVPLRFLHDTFEPFGTAEALALNEKSIWIGFDNNQKPLSGGATRAFGVQGSFPVIVELERPRGF